MRVQSHSHTQVLERVLLSRHSVDSKNGGSQLRLHFVGVDQSRQVGVGHDGSRQGVTSLQLVREESLQSLEGTLSPDDQSAEVSTGSHLKEGQVVHVHRLDTGEVSDGLVDAGGPVVDDNRTDSSSPSSVSPLTVTGSELLGFLASEEFVFQTHGGEESDGVLGLDDGGSFVGDD